MWVVGWMHLREFGSLMSDHINLGLCDQCTLERPSLFTAAASAASAFCLSGDGEYSDLWHGSSSGERHRKLLVL